MTVKMMKMYLSFHLHEVEVSTGPQTAELRPAFLSMPSSILISSDAD